MNEAIMVGCLSLGKRGWYETSAVESKVTVGRIGISQVRGPQPPVEAQLT